MARIEGFREQKQEVVQIELRRRETRQQLQKAISENDRSDHDVLSSRGTLICSCLSLLNGHTHCPPSSLVKDIAKHVPQKQDNFLLHSPWNDPQLRLPSSCANAAAF